MALLRVEGYIGFARLLLEAVGRDILALQNSQ
jgi:hypothetical protein